jgi:hypothetical protein
VDPSKSLYEPGANGSVEEATPPVVCPQLLNKRHISGRATKSDFLILMFTPSIASDGDKIVSICGNGNSADDYSITRS